MTIKKIHIENYLCYHGLNSFQFENGLNIILGENNEGKTKFFEAIDWLFNGKNSDLGILVSAKKLNETAPGDSFRVSVSMTVNQYNSEYKISRSFTARKDENKQIETSNFMFEGEENDTVTGQREPKNGQLLLDRIFPFQIRKYSMFKGETELNIFENEEALANLINLFSDARHFDKYSEKGTFLREKAEAAVEQSTKQNKKNQKDYNLLESEIAQLEKEKEKYRVHLTTTEEEQEKLDKNIKQAEKYVDNAEALETINNRIKKTEQKISDLNASINENYTTSLFDENWILVNFEPLHKEFANKVTKHSKSRRKLQSDFDIEKGRKEGELKAKAELLNNVIPLPIGVPSKTYMEEMLNDQICKVCNRKAKKGSKPYEFMMERLKSYLESQAVQENEPDVEKPLFEFDYINRLENLSVSHEDNLKNIRSIRNKIKELFEFNDDRKRDIEEYKGLLEKERIERERILGSSKISDENKIINIFKNYTNWQEDLRIINEDRFKIEAKLQHIIGQLNSKKAEKDKIDLNSASSFLLKTREILRDIESIILDTKDKKFDEFIEKLESKSNKFLNHINVEAFTGRIKFSKKRYGTDKVKIDVSLFESGGRYFVPGTAVRTSMNISILLAISELANEVRDETFPMIFDAPTSSFGETKTGDFLNLIHETSNQKIILLKDFVGSIKNPDGSIKDIFIKDGFNSIKRKKAFWIKLERPFDKNQLHTINTDVIPL